MTFSQFDLNAKLLQAVDAAGFSHPTKIQEQGIPAILTGGDVMASAQTGTGKTAAFVLPILHRLLTTKGARGKGPRCLILTPTRELATQINDDISRFGRFSKPKTGSVVGGVGYGLQIRMLGNVLDMLVATPGRLMDHMAEGRVDFNRLEVLVLDEADRMLDMGFVRDVRKIASALPKERQSLLFSATLEGRVLSIAKEVTRDPITIRLAANTRRHEGIRQIVHCADDQAHKQKLLQHYLDSEELTQAVIFTRTKRRARRLAAQLSRRGQACAELHGDMRQSARRRTVDSMRAGKIRTLVATDVAARGLDIKGISHVINFDLPMVGEDYIHRIGRTGRAGATGIAVSLVCPEEGELLSNIHKLTNSKLNCQTVEGLEPSGKALDTRPSQRKKGNGPSKHRQKTTKSSSEAKRRRSRRWNRKRRVAAA